MPSIPTVSSHLPSAHLPPAPIAAQQPPAIVPGKGLPSSAATPRSANRSSYALSSSADAVKRMSQHLGKTPPALGLGDLPPELIHQIAAKLDNPLDVLALAHSGGRLHATLESELKTVRVDLLIANVRSASQYNYALDEVRAMPEALRAERIAELARKSNHSQDRPVEAFKPLAAALEELPSQHRGAGFGVLTELLRQMSVRDIPLTRDQERGHATLLRLAKDMPPPLQRAVLVQLSQAWLPPESIINAEEALAALGPAPARPAKGLVST